MTERIEQLAVSSRQVFKFHEADCQLPTANLKLSYASP